MSLRWTDPKTRFHELAIRTLKPKRKPGTYLKTNLAIPKNREQIKAFAPSILPEVKPKAGYEYFEHRLYTTKNRRKWYPNYRPHTLPVQILGGRETTEGKTMCMSPMKLRMEDVEAIETAGGVEAFLMHTSGSKLSDHGKIYRQHLFQELNRMRDTREWYAGPSSKAKWIKPKSLPKESAPEQKKNEAEGAIGEGTPLESLDQAEEDELLIGSSTSIRDLYGPGRHGIRAGGFSTTRPKTDEEISRDLKIREAQKDEVEERKVREGAEKARRRAEMRATESSEQP